MAFCRSLLALKTTPLFSFQVTKFGMSPRHFKCTLQRQPTPQPTWGHSQTSLCSPHFWVFCFIQKGKEDGTQVYDRLAGEKVSHRGKGGVMVTDVQQEKEWG